MAAGNFVFSGHSVAVGYPHGDTVLSDVFVFHGFERVLSISPFKESRKNNRESLSTPRLWNTYSTNRKLTVFP